MSRKTVTRMTAIHAGDAERSTSKAASISTARMRSQMATTLIPTPSPPRRRDRRLTLGIASALPSSRGELARLTQSEPMEDVAGDDPERRQPIHDAAPEPDRGRFVEVAGRHRDLTDPSGHPRGNDLGDELLIEDEVVAVEVVRDRLEQSAAVRPQTGVVFGQVKSKREILDGGQESVAHELPPRHPTTEW